VAIGKLGRRKSTYQKECRRSQKQNEKQMFFPSFTGCSGDRESSLSLLLLLLMMLSDTFWEPEPNPDQNCYI
jgi:hypothetical protein